MLSKFFAIRFRGFQGVRDLRDMRGFHGFHFPRGLVDRIVRDLERLLRRFQSGNFDRAVFHVNTVQINIFATFTSCGNACDEIFSMAATVVRTAEMSSPTYGTTDATCHSGEEVCL